MNTLDFGIIIVLIIFFASRSKISLVYYLLASGSLFAGYVLGIILSPVITNNIESDLKKGAVSLILIFGLAILLCKIGAVFGDKLRMKVILSSFFRLDKLLAIPGKIVIALLAVVLLSQTLIYVPVLGLQFVAQGSSILMPTDKLFPESPIEKLAKKIAPDQFHNIHLDYDSFPLTFNNIANAGDFQTVVNNVAPSVVKVSGRSCVGLGSGSGFVVSPGLVVTNAHVIAGSSTIYISDHQGTYPATPVLIDSEHDISVLYSKFITDPPIVLSNKKASPGTESVVLGYPGAGDLQMKRAIVANESIVNFNSKKSKITPSNSLTLNGATGPGNSGGPVLNPAAKAIGVLNGGAGEMSVAISSDQVITLVNKAKGKLFPSRTNLCEVFNGYY